MLMTFTKTINGGELYD